MCPDREGTLAQRRAIKVNLYISQERGIIAGLSSEFFALSPTNQVFQIIAAIKLMENSPELLPISPPVILIMNQQTRFWHINASL